MIPPELTYQFSALKDVSGALLSIVLRRGDTSTTAATVNELLYTVPNDKILILSAASVQANPGTGQTAELATLRIVEENAATSGAGYTFARAPDVQNATANIKIALTWCGEVWVSPGEQVVVRGVFDAGTNANQVVSSIAGVTIPRGNVQQG